MATGLAFVGKIISISPIENSDRIEAAEVVCGEGGKWLGVVGKEQFKAGDPCVVYLQDAIVKPSEELAFLEKYHWRVKVQRLRGVPSECVITAGGRLEDVGTDLTESLGVEKYEKLLPASLGGDAIGNFPSAIPKTDEPNFQTAGRLVAALRDQPWYATVKCDGSSTTAYRAGDHFGVCSRNMEKKEFHTNAFWMVANKYDLKNKLPDGIALQWETCGPGIQKNPMGLKEVDGFAFQAYHIASREYLSYRVFQELCKTLGFPMAHVAACGECFRFTDDELRKLAEGEYANGKQREGIVIRPEMEQRVRNQRLSFKVINLLYKD